MWDLSFLSVILTFCSGTHPESESPDSSEAVPGAQLYLADFHYQFLGHGCYSNNKNALETLRSFKKRSIQAPHYEILAPLLLLCFMWEVFEEKHLTGAQPQATQGLW